MKQIILWLILLLFVVACSTQRGMIKVNNNVSEAMAEDSVEYELETFDYKFETWYQLHKSPARYRSLEYYEHWNDIYVAAWNAHVMSGRRTDFFEPIIGYDYNEDYGFELNHELFHYFQYVEHVLKIKIISSGPKTVFY